jgi:phosphomannomutase/phosphoglucomutase
VTPEIRVDTPDAVKFDLVKQVQQRFTEYSRTNEALGPARLILRDVVTIDGVRAVFDDGWGLIRASNTQPALVLRFEATSLQRLEAIRAVVEGEFTAAKRALGH